MPKNITTEVREIILKVKEFMDEEKRMQVPIIPLSKVYVRVSAATGVSERTVLNIVKEARLVEQGLLDPETLKKTPKKRVRTKGKIEVDEYDLQVIRRKIHEFYAFKKEVPTINKLLQILKEEINFKGSRETLRKILRKNGFQFRKTKNNKEKEQAPDTTSAVPPMVAPYIHTMFSHKNIQS
ncbi:uncharacterized protein LOC110376556 [Helicoverpa armigera]|uniref:Uncharacterized protein n=1 Tax=Helicoverpa armigera TaxID=29058 RepID=A0A2W1BRI5_HELAM|nr:uncharacterized protein LOC110376556 [Helicoverpa armigera]XP_047040687.1 uncharacterized protein LOC124645007 [Helicoverpa zea]PZC77689.1 hypothetical protein B5X24_HaOG203056 [Helicoverpa armigera]